MAAYQVLVFNNLLYNKKATNNKLVAFYFYTLVFFIDFIDYVIILEFTNNLSPNELVFIKLTFVPLKSLLIIKLLDVVDVSDVLVLVSTVVLLVELLLI
jgi:hypothetical protein